MFRFKLLARYITNTYSQNFVIESHGVNINSLRHKKQFVSVKYLLVLHQRCNQKNLKGKNPDLFQIFQLFYKC